MITTETHSSRNSGPTAAVRRVLHSVWLGLTALIRAMIHRRDVRGLLDLDERSLQDIGLSRADVVDALAEPIAKNPSTILLVRSVDRRSRLRALSHAARRVKEPVTTEAL